MQLQLNIIHEQMEKWRACHIAYEIFNDQYWKNAVCKFLKIVKELYSEN